MIPTAPRYSRVEIFFRENAGSKILNEILKSSQDTMKVYEDCAVMITGDFLLIMLDNITEVPETVKYTKTVIIPLEQVESYKVFNF